MPTSKERKESDETRGTPNMQIEMRPAQLVLPQVGGNNLSSPGSFLVLDPVRIAGDHTKRMISERKTVDSSELFHRRYN
jgi:hypothetical protein